MGSLTVSNSTGQDAIVKLVPNGADFAASKFIVRNDATDELDEIADGTYRVMFGLGADWDTPTQQFRDTRSAQRFDETFQFNTTEMDSGWRYTTYEITLHTVPLGTARTSTIPDAEFARF
jgi:hypothetical protein